MTCWQQFVVENGWRTRGAWLARVLEQPVEDIQRFRLSAKGVCRRLPRPLDFGELFTRWRGRAPADDEWPAPQKVGGGYEWLTPERMLLASLVGVIGPDEICRTLTDRLRSLTGDATAERNRNMLNVAMQFIGLEMKMPWHGKPEPCNLRVTWALLQTRRHPERCTTCRNIWGHAGAPRTYEDYAQRYPPLAHGAKRHLTRVYSDGLTREQLARDAGVCVTTVQRAIENGVLREHRVGRTGYITRTDATRWKARKCATGDNPKSWLSVATACRWYAFTPSELAGYIASGRLRSRVGQNGAMRGVTYVPRQQVRELRDELGYTEAEAARRAGVSIERLRVLLRGLDWRPAPRIPFDTVNACIKRKKSAQGVTIAQAARRLRKSVAWVQNEINAGTVRVLRTKWHKRRLYITAPMLERLRAVARDPRPRPRWTAEWLYLSEAAHLAGVSIATVQRWADDGDVSSRQSPNGRRYHRRSLMARARKYWLSEVRFKRAAAPSWLQEPAA